MGSQNFIKQNVVNKIINGCIQFFQQNKTESLFVPLLQINATLTLIICHALTQCHGQVSLNEILFHGGQIFHFLNGLLISEATTLYIVTCSLWPKTNKLGQFQHLHDAK